MRPLNTVLVIIAASLASAPLATHTLSFPRSNASPTPEPATTPHTDETDTLETSPSTTPTSIPDTTITPTTIAPSTTTTTATPQNTTTSPTTTTSTTTPPPTISTTTTTTPVTNATTTTRPTTTTITPNNTTTTTTTTTAAPANTTTTVTPVPQESTTTLSPSPSPTDNSSSTDVTTTTEAPTDGPHPGTSIAISLFALVAVVLLIGAGTWWLRRRWQLERLRHQLMPVYNFDPTDDVDDWENQLLEEERSLRPEADKVHLYSGNATFEAGQKPPSSATPKE